MVFAIIMAIVGLALVLGAGALWGLVGLTGTMRTDVQRIDARGCDVLVFSIDSVTVSPPPQIPEFLIDRVAYTAYVDILTAGLVAGVDDPATDLVGVDYCAATSQSGEWLVTTITSIGTPLPPGTPLDPVSVGVYRVSPSDMSARTIAVAGTPVGAVELVGVITVGNTAATVFAMLASGRVALVGAILCVAVGQGQGRHQGGGSA